MKQTVLGRVWRKASAHAAGSGLETGVPCFSGARKAKKMLAARGDFSRLSALNAVVCGGATLRSRRQKGILRKCQRCGRAQDDIPEHRYHRCAHNRLIDDPDAHISTTNWIADKLRTLWPEYESLWARAIAPAALLQTAAPEEKQQETPEERSKRENSKDKSGDDIQ